MYSSYLTELPDSLFAMRPLGKGWTHTYNSYIKKISSGGLDDQEHLTVFCPSGSIHVYKKMGNSYDCLTEGVYDSFQETPNGFSITTKSQVTYNYAKPDNPFANHTTPYLLQSIGDRNNNQITLHHQSTLPSGTFNLDKVEGTAGRFIDFHYDNGKFLMKSATDPSGKIICFYFNEGVYGNPIQAEGMGAYFEKIP